MSCSINGKKGIKMEKKMKQLHSSTVRTLFGIFEVQFAMFVLQENFIT